MLADVLQDVVFIRENMATKEDVARIMRDALAQAGVTNTREPLPNVSTLVKSDQGRNLLLTALQRFRELPLEVQRTNPELFDMAGKIGQMTGDYEQAQAAFAVVSELSANKLDQAQAHYNTYLAALEQGAKAGKSEAWTAALNELIEAAKLDPQRFTPFDLGKYEPIKILGTGGFGVTFLCRNRTTEGHRAIKSLHTEQLEDARRQQVLDEGKILEQIQHPNIVRIFDIEFAVRPDQRPYFVMEYCDGFQTLEQFVNTNGKLKPADLREVARQIAEGLKAAHEKRVLHRDIKPANVLVRRDGTVWQVRLIDFGLALRSDLLQAGQQSSKAKDALNILGREIAGTRAYAPPEQMDEERHAEVAKHSDIYSLGKTCYFALFGKPDPDDDEKQGLSPELRSVLSRCTAGTISKRPKDVDELIKAFNSKSAGHTDPAVNTVALKAAGASLLPGLGHLLFVPSQRAKGIVLLLTSLFVLIPCLGFYWPSVLVAWLLLVATDAFCSVRASQSESESQPVLGDEKFRGKNAAYIDHRGQKVDVKFEDLVVLAARGVIREDTSVWIAGYDGKKWHDFKDVRDKFPSLALATRAKPNGTHANSSGWTIFGVRWAEMDRRSAVLAGAYCISVLAVVMVVASWLATVSTETVQPDPRFTGVWTKPDDAGSNMPYDGRHWRANYSLTVTSTTLNWTYVEQVGRGPSNVNTSCRYRWTKTNEIQLLDAKTDNGAKQIVTIRLEFISDQELILIVENEEKLKYNPFAYLKGKFRRQ
jgi:serine/threonine-protein kinase